VVRGAWGFAGRFGRSARAAAPVLAAALAGCAGLSPPGGSESQLFAQVYSDVTHYHLKETGPDRLALATLQSLNRIDPAIAVAAEGNEVVLRDHDVAERFAVPADAGDSDEWGRLTVRAIKAARALSPRLAAVPPEIADERLLDGALGTLDRFSRYARPEVARERRAERDGFIGVGVTLDISDGAVRIATVLPDTPAAAAGVHAADRILAIDGQLLDKPTRSAVGERLRGPKDGAVTLELARAGSANLTLTMRRAVIVGETATLKERGSVAWLKLRSFNQRTAQSAAALLEVAHREMGDKLTGIVLDLRENPGGLLDQAVEVAQLFLDGGPIASTVGRLQESDQSFTAKGGQPHETLPLVVLVNGGSASSAEVVAAALQDRGRAVVAGSASFGKGTVQTVFRTGNGGELTVTWAELIMPGGYHLHHHGVVPTVCTSELGDSGAAAALGEARKQLDDAGWRQLRAACPPQRGAYERDAAAAERLLGTPALYRAALIVPAGDTPRPAEARLPK
jgi:carboxyl-terminal processing protease